MTIFEFGDVYMLSIDQVDIKLQVAGVFSYMLDHLQVI